MSKKFGKLKKIDLREVWPNEAADFSVWLAEQGGLDLLSNELGISISLIKREASVGKFSVDILAEEEGTGRKIIIENQLETTNHDHLGKIITYAAGYGAPIIIWLFKNIREEHREAIDWLNNNTDENVYFFPVKVEVWQIDNSKFAPKFQIIGGPNEWAKTIKRGSNDELGETKLKQLNYWTKLKNYAEEKNLTLFSQTPYAGNWYNITIGSSDARIRITINTQKNMLVCEIYIRSNKDLFRYLEGKKNEIENEIGSTLEWSGDDDKIGSNILQRKMGFDIDNEKEMEASFDWLIDRTTAFERVFGKFLEEYKRG
ncbi:MAG: DUF4268 domain-containing protein [Candidatus Campbellbacteria bacterium]|nr:DUF4268 domain-containing protein [Candidatus Campbellbacteria bacterium]